MTVYRQLLLLMIFLATALPALAGPPAAGDHLAGLSLTAPQEPEPLQQLGLQQPGPFTLTDLGADLIFVEVIGIYCPFCIKQAPGYRTLYGRLNKGKLKGRVAMFALAAGATDAEVRKLLETGQYMFPVLSDPDYVAHKQLGEPLTPYTLICRPDGTVLFAHLGVIDDVDDLYQTIKGLLD